MATRITRRTFLRGVGAGAAAVHVVGAHVLGGQGRTPPSETMTLAGIGCGGQGGQDIHKLASLGQKFVALCDVDDKRAGNTYKKFPEAKTYRDFRKMLDAVEGRIDGVVVGTPDHTHTVAAMDAIKRGKHVYCEKPLAHYVWEVRQLMKAARQYKVVTQLGNQGHSSEHIRLFVEWVRDGAIGQVHTVHAGCGAFKNVYCQIDKLPELEKRPEVPGHLDWDLWLGPAQHRPYSPVFVPWNWRGWTPFGTGCIGDWVCHVVDPSYWALGLGAPTSVRAEVEGYDPKKHHLCYPPATKITYEFPARGRRGPVTLIWYDGNNKIPRPEELEKGRRVPATGAVVVGSKGKIMHGSHGAGGCRLIPEDAMKAYERPEPTIPRTKGHHEDWVQAVREGRKAGSDFAEYGGPLTEVALLGMIAVWYPTQTLRWDAGKMQFTNFPEANKHITPRYREGWTL
jgi:hypothetical protein